MIKSFKINRKNKIKQCHQDKIFDIINATLIVLALLMIVLPLMNLIALSFSDSQSTLTGKVFFWPMKDGKPGFIFEQFKYVLGFLDSSSPLTPCPRSPRSTCTQPSTAAWP